MTSVTARTSATTILVGLVAAAAVALSQPRLASTVHGIKQRDDVYVLPPPGELRAATLGYRAAVADVLWGQLLVEYGIHWSEKRPFPDLEKYMDAILALDPKFKTLYLFCDTMLVYRPLQGYEKDARTARAYLERGTRELPYDPDVWLEYGQYVAFLGPSWLEKESDREQWRRDGAHILMRAVELGADPNMSLNIVHTLRRFGERDAAAKQLERAYALTDDPDVREKIAAQLEALRGQEDRERTERDLRFIEGRWRKDYPFLSRGTYLLSGPAVDPGACAGLDRAGSPACAHDWGSALPSKR